MKMFMKSTEEEDAKKQKEAEVRRRKRSRVRGSIAHPNEKQKESTEPDETNSLVSVTKASGTQGAHPHNPRGNQMNATHIAAKLQSFADGNEEDDDKKELSKHKKQQRGLSRKKKGGRASVAASESSAHMEFSLYDLQECVVKGGRKKRTGRLWGLTACVRVAAIPTLTLMTATGKGSLAGQTVVCAVGNAVHVFTAHDVFVMCHHTGTLTARQRRAEVEAERVRCSESLQDLNIHITKYWLRCRQAACIVRHYPSRVPGARVTATCSVFSRIVRALFPFTALRTHCSLALMSSCPRLILRTSMWCWRN